MVGCAAAETVTRSPATKHPAIREKYVVVIAAIDGPESRRVAIPFRFRP
jgi:hypothetical protein